MTDELNGELRDMTDDEGLMTTTAAVFLPNPLDESVLFNAAPLAKSGLLHNLVEDTMVDA